MWRLHRGVFLAVLILGAILLIILGVDELRRLIIASRAPLGTISTQVGYIVGALFLGSSILAWCLLEIIENPSLPQQRTTVSVRGFSRNLRVLEQLWTDRYPQESPKDHTLLEKLILSPLLIIQGTSLSYLGAAFTRTERMWSNWRDVYLITWLVSLSTILFILDLKSSTKIVIAIYRLVDIISYHLCIVLVDSQQPNS